MEPKIIRRAAKVKPPKPILPTKIKLTPQALARKHALKALKKKNWQIKQFLLEAQDVADAFPNVGLSALETAYRKRKNLLLLLKNHLDEPHKCHQNIFIMMISTLRKVSERVILERIEGGETVYAIFQTEAARRTKNQQVKSIE